VRFDAGEDFTRRMSGGEKPRQFRGPGNVAVAERHGALGGGIAILEMDEVRERCQMGDFRIGRRFADGPGIADIDQRLQLRRRRVGVGGFGQGGEEIGEVGDRADVADGLVLDLHRDGISEAEVGQPLEAADQVGRLVAGIAQVAEDADLLGAEHGGHVEGMDQRVVCGAVGRIEGEVDRAAFAALAGRGPFQQRRDEGRDAQALLLQPPCDQASLLERHAEQVPALHGAHVEATHLVFAAEGDHFVEGRADFIADDGESETGKGHAANLLWSGRFG